MKPWQEDICAFVITHRIIQFADPIPLDCENTFYAPFDALLKKMKQAELLAINKENQTYIPAEKLSNIYENIEHMLDILDVFEIFACVHLDRELSPKESDNGIDVLPNLADPRFAEVENQEENENIADLRLACLEYLNQQPHTDHFDMHRIVALYFLQNGRFDEQDVYEELASGLIFDEISALMEESVHWEELADLPDEASLIMEEIIKAGLREAYRRDDSLVAFSLPAELASFSTPILP